MKKKKSSIRKMSRDNKVALDKKSMNMIKGGYAATDDLWEWR